MCWIAKVDGPIVQNDIYCIKDGDKRFINLLCIDGFLFLVGCAVYDICCLTACCLNLQVMMWRWW